MGGVGVGTLTILGPPVEALIVTLINTCNFLLVIAKWCSVTLIKSDWECCACFLKVQKIKLVIYGPDTLLRMKIHKLNFKCPLKIQNCSNTYRFEPMSSVSIASV